MDRRTVLQAGGVIAAAGVVAACGSSADSADASASDTGAATASDPGTGSAGGTALAATQDIPVGGGIVIAEPAIVITQPAEGEFKAFTAICPHQGCLVSEVSDNEILCPCHGSLFSATDGAVIQGPARQGLTPAGVAVDGGSVVLS